MIELCMVISFAAFVWLIGYSFGHAIGGARWRRRYEQAAKGWGEANEHANELFETCQGMSRIVGYWKRRAERAEREERDSADWWKDGTNASDEQ